uniref:Uncharacterized protein n=1 Tax=Oryza barthii TaxID=65489 RepID=A0A0D3FL71_9ORYZ
MGKRVREGTAAAAAEAEAGVVVWVGIAAVEGAEEGEEEGREWGGAGAMRVPSRRRRRPRQSAASPPASDVGGMPPQMEFLMACTDGDVARLKEVVDSMDEDDRESLATVRMEGYGPLFEAASSGKIDLCKYLVEELGFDVNAETSCDSGMTPLFCAVLDGQEIIVKYFLDKGADPNKKDAAGFAPLHEAAKKGHVGIARLLLSKGASVDVSSSEGTPLHVAASNGKSSIVQILLELHANPNTMLRDCYTPLTAVLSASADKLNESECLKYVKLPVKEDQVNDTDATESRTSCLNAVENNHFSAEGGFFKKASGSIRRIARSSSCFRLLRSFLIFVMIMNPVAVVNSNKCDSTELAVNMALFCRIDRPTSFCCDIIMSSVQHCGGLNMICLASESPVIISSGYTPQNVIIWYVQCGGELPTSHTSTNTIDHSSLCYPGAVGVPSPVKHESSSIPGAVGVPSPEQPFTDTATVNDPQRLAKGTDAFKALLWNFIYVAMAALIASLLLTILLFLKRRKEQVLPPDLPPPLPAPQAQPQIPAPQAQPEQNLAAYFFTAFAYQLYNRLAGR